MKKITGKDAYLWRVKHRATWKTIAKRLGYSDPGSARASAMRYAKKHDELWPIKAFFRPDFAHMCRDEGMNYLQIARELDIKINYAYLLIRRHKSKS
tara:strand:- start:197 stop:487 length:291 start_codon:yes stop_codon:yes gene_type:complete